MDAPQTPGKRKRETNAPRITYHAASRTFDRLFKEESLDETKDVVRRKLGLPDSSSIRLAQIRGEHTVDLEDEDDFDAFYAMAHSRMTIEVQVTTEDMSPSHASSSSSQNHNAVSPPAPSNNIASSSPEVSVNDEIRASRKVTFLDPDTQNLPPKKRRRATLANASDSAAPYDSQPDIVVSPTRDISDSAENLPEPAIPPKKIKKKAERTISKSSEVETSSRPRATSITRNHDDTEAVNKPKLKKKSRKEPETEHGSTSSTFKASDETANSAPAAIAKSSKKSKKQKAETSVNAFSQQLAQTITDGHLASAELQDASDHGAPPPPVAKAKVSESLTNGRAKTAEPMSETTEHERPDVTIKPKKKKKPEDRVFTPDELEAVKSEMNRLVASLTTNKPHLLSQTKPQPLKPTTRLSQKPATSANILAIAKSKESRTNSSTPREDDAPSSNLKKSVIPTKSSLASEPESSDDDDDDVYCLLLLHLTKKVSAWPSSDSDNAYYESASDDVASVSNGLSGVDQPPTLEDSKKDSIGPDDTIEPESHFAPDGFDDTPASGQVDPVQTPAHKTFTETSSDMPHSVTPTNKQAPVVPRVPSSSHGFLDEHDPIEPIVPSPRSQSPIENALATKNSMPTHRTRPTTTYSKPEIVLVRRSTRKSQSQPISKHEADVRQSVVRLTKAKSTAQIQTPRSPAPPPSPTLPSPRRLRSATQPARVIPTGESLNYQTPASAQEKQSQTLANMWTTLHAEPSSTVDAESSHGDDELHSSPGHEPATGPENPLFTASESQVDFPYSQFQDINLDTDNGADEPLIGVDRLDEDSEEEEEVQETITPRVTRRSSTAYRGLSEIAGQNKFFAGFQPSSVPTSTPINFKEDMYGPLSQAYDDDASDSGSESGTEKSHIPRARRAGNKR
ncbi:Carbamoyl-phosphate synthase arginine-specific small chain [Lentinula edodes]|uniref:Carbamoyl-phosphate synthase arginine-specific small chain n=1 Tax=Lentinula edodes TaxID=5353 RepID=A0A1Q3EAS1_LENED|nr:Carbamoyl-phosphate synthase arginine-specific small chain [Lentinula edodes]